MALKTKHFQTVGVVPGDPQPFSSLVLVADGRNMVSSPTNYLGFSLSCNLLRLSWIMSVKRTPRKRGSSQVNKASYPADAFYAPLFKDNPKKLAKFVKWINGSSAEDITKVLVAINEAVSRPDPSVATSWDAMGTKLECIVLADIVQSGYRSYGVLTPSDSDRRLESQLTVLGIDNGDVVRMIVKLVRKMYKSRNSKLAMDATDVCYPHFESLRWRLDVTISNSNLKRVLKPSVVLSFTLSDGRIKYMECSVDKFHELRFNVSRVLREMQVLRQRFIHDSAHAQPVEEPQYLVKSQRAPIVAAINNLSIASPPMLQ